MASSDQAGSWWGNLIKSAKEKSLSAMEVIKTDLAEFTSTMTNDTTNILNQASAQLNTSSGEQSTTSLLQNITRTISNNLNFNMNLSQNENERPQTSSRHETGTSSIHDRFKQELRLLQTNENTFLCDPVANEANFAEWQNKFNPDEYKSIISDLLIQNSNMRLLYSQLVPAQLSNIQFWSRYFFKVSQLEEEHKKRVKLLEKATTNETQENISKEESLDWGDEDDSFTISREPLNEQIEDKIEPETDTNKTALPLELNVQNKTETEKPEEEIKTEKEKQIEPEAKTEDSDEWEKVSDVLVSENETDKKVACESDESDELDKTQTENQSHSDLSEKQEPTTNETTEPKDLSKLRENVLSKLEKTEPKSSNIDAEWDDWDE